MSMRFLRGNAQTPRGHAIIFARSTRNANDVLSTYCIVLPIPMSLQKFIPPMFASQFQAEGLSEMGNETKQMPLPPILEDGKTLAQLEVLAERRGDDLCEMSTISPDDPMARLQGAAMGCEEYAGLYNKYAATFEQETPALDAPLDDLDADELLLQSMTDRQRLAELGKYVGTARYAMEGHDTSALQETQRKMQRLVSMLPEKYRGEQLVTAALDANPRGARLASLYLERAYKLLDEEYSEIPNIERAIRELQESEQ